MGQHKKIQGGAAGRRAERRAAGQATGGQRFGRGGGVAHGACAARAAATTARTSSALCVAFVAKADPSIGEMHVSSPMSTPESSRNERGL